MPSTSHYEALGVARGASQDEIKRAYHTQARTCHPDRSRDHEAQFLTVNAAYETLADPVRRTAYDAALASARGDVAGGVRSSGSGGSSCCAAPAVAVWAEVELGDMERDDDSDAFTYACRCGDYYEIYDEDLAQPLPGATGAAPFFHYLSCGGCSLRVRLLTVTATNATAEPAAEPAAEAAEGGTSGWLET